jgi:hypothetical protein
METIDDGGETKMKVNVGQDVRNGQTVKIGGDDMKKSPKRSEAKSPQPNSEKKTTNGTRRGQNQVTKATREQKTTSGTRLGQTSDDHQTPQNTNRPRPSPRKPLAKDSTNKREQTPSSPAKANGDGRVVET